MNELRLAFDVADNQSYKEKNDKGVYTRKSPITGRKVGGGGLGIYKRLGFGVFTFSRALGHIECPTTWAIYNSRGMKRWLELTGTGMGWGCCRIDTLRRLGMKENHI